MAPASSPTRRPSARRRSWPSSTRTRPCSARSSPASRRARPDAPCRALSIRRRGPRSAYRRRRTRARARLPRVSRSASPSYDEGPTGCDGLPLRRAGRRGVLDRRVAAGSPRRSSGAGTSSWSSAVCFGRRLALTASRPRRVSPRSCSRGASTAPTGSQIPLVAGAIIFDWGPRGRTPVYPDKELGRAALTGRGAGQLSRSAGTAPAARRRRGSCSSYEESEPAGQGGAWPARRARRGSPSSRVVNAIGAIVDRDGNVVLGHFDARQRRTAGARADRRGSASPRAGARPAAAREHDADPARDGSRGSTRASCRTARPPGARVDGAGDPAVPRARGRRRALRRVDRRGRARPAARHDGARRRCVRAWRRDAVLSVAG